VKNRLYRKPSDNVTATGSVIGFPIKSNTLGNLTYTNSQAPSLIVIHKWWRPSFRSGLPEPSVQACPELVDGNGKHRFMARLVDSALNVASLRRCVRQITSPIKWTLPHCEGSEKKVSRKGATTQRKRIKLWITAFLMLIDYFVYLWRQGVAALRPLLRNRLATLCRHGCILSK